MMKPWFADAKFGIFLHWGIYSVKGIPESWSWFKGEISREDYFGQRAGFTASKYDPEAWAELFQRSGARYAVLTAKHHDGFALWPTAHRAENSVAATPAGRDLIGPYCEALRRRGLHVGLYFSHLDWSHPDFASVRDSRLAPDAEVNPLDHAPAGSQDEGRWQAFLRFHRAQLQELCEYKPELFFFDGDWPRHDEQWRMKELREQLHSWAPGVIMNDRMGRPTNYGDYASPEQGVPIRRPKAPFEFCMTVNDSWGYQVQDHHHKSPRQLIRYLADIVGMGGNLLLDIGPHADGSLQSEQVERLEAIGRWLTPRGEAIYGTRAGLGPEFFLGSSTLSQEGDVLYLFQYDQVRDKVAVKGIHNAVKRVSVVGNPGHGEALSFEQVGGAPWMDVPGVLWIDVPNSVQNELCTVIKVELDGALRAYEGAGQAISAN